MAARAFTHRLLAPLRGVTNQPTSTVFRLGRPYSTPASTTASTPANTPPYLQKLKGDLKTAMRAKDAPRLAVLRSIITTTLNASKTDKPISTDLQLVSLLGKAKRSSLDAAREFQAAEREDLAGKEQEQARIAQEYIDESGVKILSEEELRELVKEAVEAVKAEGVSEKAITGQVMKKVIAPRQKEVIASWGHVPKIVKELTEQ